MGPRNTDLTGRPVQRPQPPGRDPMDVGLARKRPKRRNYLPPWLEENFGWVVIGITIATLSLVTLLLNSGQTGPQRPKGASEQAHLAVTLGPLKTFAPGSTTVLNKVSLTIKNMGPAQATNVLVKARAGKVEFALKGPKLLAVGEQKEYVMNREVEIPSKASLLVGPVCWNCPYTPGPPP